jgi:hypothetical protein
MKVPVEKFPRPAPSFAGAASIMLVAAASIIATASVLCVLLADACSPVCPW